MLVAAAACMRAASGMAPYAATLTLARALTRRLRPHTPCSFSLSRAPPPRWAANLEALTATWSGLGIVSTMWSG